MAFVEYKFVRETPDIVWMPPWIKAGGFWLSPLDESFVGWEYEPEEINYFIPKNFKRLGRGDFINRQLAIHAQVSFTKPDPNDEDIRYDMTTQEVIDEMGTWYDTFVTDMAASLPQFVSNRMKSEAISAAFLHLETRLEDAFVSVAISSTGQNEPFGVDKTTQENIIGTNTAIAVGVPLPDPMYWTPKGSATPVVVTHGELATIGGAILNKKNEYYQNYFTHKAAINALSNVADILKYDYTTGYN